MTASLYLQERFLLKNDEESEQLKWSVPLTWTTKSQAPTGFQDTKPKEWLFPNDTSKPLPNIEIRPDEWIIFNNQEAGMFLVVLSHYEAVLGCTDIVTKRWTGRHQLEESFTHKDKSWL
jgi:hypothetical protein